jgi:DNA-binding response OmpR family regulator
MRILLAEDEDAQRSTFVRQLEQRGHQVAAYGTVLEAGEAVREADADLVWTGLVFADPSHGGGIELIRAARLHLPAVQILVVSGHTDGGNVLAALRSGADHFLPKPVDTSDFHAVMRRIEAIRAAHRDKVRAWNSFARCDLELRVPADLGVAAAAAALFGKHARSFLDEPGCRGLQSAVHEILLNSIEHGCLEITREEKLSALSANRYSELIAARRADPALGARSVRARMTADGDQGVTITLTDPGPGFDPEALPDPSDPENIFLEGGRGILMARLHVAEMSYEDGGRTAILVARRGAAPAC